MSLLGRLFGRNDDEMAESESLEWAIENQYADLLIKRHQYEQMQEAQRNADRSEYEAEQRMYADRAKRYEKERKERAARVRANGGQWIELEDGSFIDGDGNILSRSDMLGSY